MGPVLPGSGGSCLHWFKGTKPEDVTALEGFWGVGRLYRGPLDCCG